MANKPTSLPKNMTPPNDTVVKLANQGNTRTNSPNASIEDRKERALPEKDIAIEINRLNGKPPINLMSSQLEKWFANCEQQLNTSTLNKNDQGQDNPALASQFVGRYGLKSSKDVISFLKSPAGVSVKGMIGERLAEIAAMQQHRNEEIQREAIMRQRRLAFLILGLIYRRKAKAHSLNEFIQKQIDKILHKNKENINQNSSPAITEARAALDTMLHAYDYSRKEIVSELHKRHSELDTLEQQLLALEHQGEIIALRHSIFTNHLSSLLAFEQEMLHLSHSDHSQVDASNLVPAFKLNAEQMIKQRIEHLQADINKQATVISQLLENGHDAEAMKLLQAQNGLHLESAGLNDMLAVIRQEKLLFNAEGKQTSSIKDAQFIIPHAMCAHKKIVKDNNQYYVIGTNQNLHELSSTDKQNAHEAFKKIRPEISHVKTQVKDNHELETSFHNECKSAAIQRRDVLKNEIQDLSNQLNQLQAAQANVSSRMKQPENIAASSAPQAIPTPTPTPKAKTHSPVKSTHFSSAESNLMHLILEFKLLRNNPNPTQDSVERFRKALMNVNKEASYDRRVQEELGKIKPGLPIQEQTVKNLSAALKQFGIDLQKPYRAEAPKPNTSPSTAPTPFSTTPKPLNRGN